jgi:hypothetical protein
MTTRDDYLQIAGIEAYGTVSTTKVEEEKKRDPKVTIVKAQQSDPYNNN